jgi:hypothetical protein
MPSITAADITHTVEASAAVRGLGTERIVKLTFGAAGLTYPTGGIPLDKAKMGCPTWVHSLSVEGAAAVAGDENYRFRWDGSNTAPKLVCFASDSASASVDEIPHQAPATAVLVAVQTLRCRAVGY